MTDSPTSKTPTEEPAKTGAIRGWVGKTRRTWQHIPLWIRHTLVSILVAFVGVIIGVQLAGNGNYQVGPLDVEMALHPALHGESTVEIPPLGALTIDSHDGPVAYNAQIRQLDEKETRAIIEDPKTLDKESKKAADDLTKAIKNLIIRSAIAAVLMATLLGLLVFRSVRRTLLTIAVAIALVGTVLGIAWETKDTNSIREPHYEGLLTNAPAVIGNAKDISDRFGEYRGALIQIITNFGQVYANLSNLPAGFQPDPNTIRVLHISDLHLNPASFDVIKPVVKQFAINAVVDTGDITDWGTDLENQYANNIGQLNVPYVFVRGNHDRAETGQAVAAQPNAYVLENQVVTVAGLTFAGVGDPRFTPDKSEGDLTKAKGQVVQAAKKLARTIDTYDEEHDKPVNIALMHDPTGADQFADSVPLVLCGHLHKRKMRDLDSDTILRVEGSTGAQGLRGFYSEELSPFNMSVLYFSKEGQLQAADEISLTGPDQQTVSLNRKLFKPKD
jgi:predicted MPP superfamily phosphohydrolase